MEEEKIEAVDKEKRGRKIVISLMIVGLIIFFVGSVISTSLLFSDYSNLSYDNDRNVYIFSKISSIIGMMFFTSGLVFVTFSNLFQDKWLKTGAIIGCCIIIAAIWFSLNFRFGYY